MANMTAVLVTGK